MTMTIKLADFGRFGLHVIRFPSGIFGYVGTVPVELADLHFPDMATAVAAYTAWKATHE